MLGALQRFFRLVDKTNKCWIWTGGTSRPSGGYGRFKPNGKSLAAHRWIYSTLIEPIPAGMCVCHKCDNPVCVKPSHLFLGTVSDNNLDAVKKNRHSITKRKNWKRKTPGITYNKQFKKWMARVPKYGYGKRLEGPGGIYLGLFPTAKAAAAAVKKYFEEI